MKMVSEVVNGKVLVLEFNPECNQRYAAYTLYVDGKPRLNWGELHTDCQEAMEGRLSLRELVKWVADQHLN